MIMLAEFVVWNVISARLFIPYSSSLSLYVCPRLDISASTHKQIQIYFADWES